MMKNDPIPQPTDIDPFAKHRSQFQFEYQACGTLAEKLQQHRRNPDLWNSLEGLNSIDFLRAEKEVANSG